MASGTYDYESEQQRIARQRQLADALMQGGLSPSRQIDRTAAGGRAIAFTPLEGIADIVQVLAGKRKTGQADEQQQALTQRYRDDLVKGMEQFQTTSEGVRVPDLAPRVGVDPRNPPMIQQQAPNPRKAVLDALSSNHPVLREMAMQELRKKPETLSAKDLLQYATPEARADMVRMGAAGFKPAQEKLAEVGGVVYDPTKREVVPLGGPKPTQATVNGDLYEQNPSTGQWRKLDNATKVNVNASPTVLNKGQSKLSEEWAKMAVADLGEAQKSAQSAQNALVGVAKMKSLQNTHQGPLAPAALWVAQIADTAGIPVDKAKLSNSETFSSESTRMWLDLMNQAGGARGLVKEESEKLAASLPNLVQSPQGRAELLGMIEARARNSMSQAAAKQKAMEAAGRADDPGVYFRALREAGLPQVMPQNPEVPGQGAAPRVRRWNPQTGRIE